MDTTIDRRTVMTLDAGGTNLVFSAIRGNSEITKPVTLPSNGHDLDMCLRSIIKGFEMIMRALDDKPVAISFAFPGPSDYENGIIGDLGNLPAFRGGIALGPMLEEHFQLPVFINNDGDLFVYGEAISGFLPWVNAKLRDAGSVKQYRNLTGVTLGTGFGGGIVRNGELLTGDNAASGEVWLLRSGQERECFAEESISIRAVVREYLGKSGRAAGADITPADIYNIATGKREGDQVAAIEAFRIFGDALGDAMANIITMFDGLVVVGGGLSKAWELISPAVIAHLNGRIKTVNGEEFPRTEVTAFNLEDNEQLAEFLKGRQKEIDVPFAARKVVYDPLKRTGVGLSRLGTSHAVSVGAYAFALNAIGQGLSG